jgi:hypothetical protein
MTRFREERGVPAPAARYVEDARAVVKAEQLAHRGDFVAAVFV